MFDAEEEGEVYIQYDIREGEKVQIRGIRLVQHHNGTIVDSDAASTQPASSGEMEQEIHATAATCAYGNQDETLVA